MNTLIQEDIEIKLKNDKTRAKKRILHNVI